MTDGPNSGWLHHISKSVIQQAVEGGQALKCITPMRHRGGAGMILLASQSNGHIADPHDVAHNADLFTSIVEIGSLLDMHLDIGMELGRGHRTGNTRAKGRADIPQ